MIIAVVFIYMNVYNYTMSSRFACFSAILLGMIIYIILLIIFKIFKYSEIKNRIIKK